MMEKSDNSWNRKAGEYDNNGKNMKKLIIYSEHKVLINDASLSNDIVICFKVFSNF